MVSGEYEVSTWNYKIDRVGLSGSNRKQIYRSLNAQSVYRVKQVQQSACILIGKCVKQK